MSARPARLPDRRCWGDWSFKLPDPFVLWDISERQKWLALAFFPPSMRNTCTHNRAEHAYICGRTRRESCWQTRVQWTAIRYDSAHSKICLPLWRENLLIPYSIWSLYLSRSIWMLLRKKSSLAFNCSHSEVIRFFFLDSSVLYRSKLTLKYTTPYYRDCREINSL